jgi:bacterial/archaeal transporter family-2 protein
LAAATGVLIAIQARSNGQLSHLISNSVEAALISFSSGLVIVAIFALFSASMKKGIKELRSAVQQNLLPKWSLVAGAMGGVVIGMQTHVLPLIGVAIYSVGTISGQTMISLLVDRIGLTGGGKKEISPRRIIAAVTTILAVVVSVLDRLSVSHFQILAVVLAIISGCLIGVQRALNGRINQYSRQNFTTSLLNFIMGTAALLLILLFRVIFSHEKVYSLPSGPWWIYLGGVTGVIYIAFSATVVQHLGVLTFTLFSVGGQLFGSLIIDLVSPISGVHVTGYLVAGILMTYVGVIVGGQSRLFRRKLK